MNETHECFENDTTGTLYEVRIKKDVTLGWSACTDEDGFEIYFCPFCGKKLEGETNE